MADPTLKDVLNAVARIEASMATKAELAKLDAKVDAHRAETRKGFADLDEELSGHAKVHRESDGPREPQREPHGAVSPRPPKLTRDWREFLSLLIARRVRFVLIGGARGGRTR